MRTNKLIAYWIVYNEEKFLPYTPITTLENVDYCVFLNGGPNGPSTDNTLNILEGFKKQYGDKVHILSGTWGKNTIERHLNWDKIMRDAALVYIEDNLLEEDEECWLLLQDADEIYLEKDVLKMKELIDIANKKEQVMIRYDYINFFYDYFHTVHDNNFSTPAHHLHIFREGFRYFDVSTLITDEYYKILCHYRPEQIMYTDQIKLYHYGHCGSYNSERLKYWRYARRGDLGIDVAKSMPDSPEKLDWVDPRIEELKDTNRIHLFSGIHPAHMLPYIEKYNSAPKSI